MAAFGPCLLFTFAILIESPQSIIYDIELCTLQIIFYLTMNRIITITNNVHIFGNKSDID